MPWYDVLLMIGGTGAFLYFAFNAMDIIQQGSNFEWYQIAIGIVGIISVIEVCRRSVGLPIIIVAVCFIVYALVWGLPNPSFSGKLNYIVHYLFYGKEGILSTPINVCSKFIVVFIIFGAFLERTGIADFFIKISNSVVGGFSGGPAKVAVVASAMEGMVSGSSVANTVGSGSVTIPLMKKTGYKPEFAAAAEASASTGGQIMPPIMGAAAFLMAEYVGVKPKTDKPTTKIDYAQKKDETLRGTYRVTAKSGLHIRTGASTDKKSLGVLKPGTTVRNYGWYNVDKNGDKWLYVAVANGFEGFCHSDYLKKC